MTNERGCFHLPWKQGCFCWYIWKKSGPIIHCDWALWLQTHHRPFLSFHSYTVTVHWSPRPWSPARPLLGEMDQPEASPSLLGCAAIQQSLLSVDSKKEGPGVVPDAPSQAPKGRVTCCFTHLGAGALGSAPSPAPVTHRTGVFLEHREQLISWGF